MNSSMDNMNSFGSIQLALVERRYSDAEHAAEEAIRENVLQPQLWVMLGEALLHQSLGAAARKAFNRAWLLDPEAAWVDEVEQALQRAPLGADRPKLDELLTYRKVTLTIGVIVKDEERSIARCLESLQGAADEILVIDSGSTDRTVEIASSFPCVRLIHLPWEDDFAKLRNKALSLMKTDWVLWVDADEVLHKDDVSVVKEIAGIYDEPLIPPVLSIWQINQLNGAVDHEFSQNRMFCLRLGLRYFGRVHEQIGPSNGDMYSAPSYRSPVRIRLLHDGYEPEIVKQKDKLHRNLKLLKQMVEEEPDNPGWWMFYGRETLSDGGIDEALRAFLKAEETAADKPHFARILDVYMYLVRIYVMKDDLAQAEEKCRKALEVNGQFPDALFYLATIQMRKAYRLYRESELLLRSSKEAFSNYRGAVSPDYEIKQWKADISLADIARSTGKFAEAAYMYDKIAQEHPYVRQVQKPLSQFREQLNMLQPQTRNQAMPTYRVVHEGSLVIALISDKI